MMRLQTAIAQLLLSQGTDSSHRRSRSRERGHQRHVVRDGRRTDLRAVGVRLWPQGGVQNQVYLSLTNQVHHVGRPLGYLIDHRNG